MRKRKHTCDGSWKDDLAGKEALDKHADMLLRKAKYKWN